MKRPADRPSRMREALRAEYLRVGYAPADAVSLADAIWAEACITGVTKGIARNCYVRRARKALGIAADTCKAWQAWLSGTQRTEEQRPWAWKPKQKPANTSASPRPIGTGRGAKWTAGR